MTTATESIVKQAAGRLVPISTEQPEPLPDLPFGNLAPLTVRTGTNYERCQTAYVNRRLVTHVTREREYRANIAEPEFTAVHLVGGQTLKVAESLREAVALLS